VREGGESAAVREGGRPEDAAVLVWIGKADEEALTLEVPTSGSVPELRGILTRLDDHGVDVAELTVHTPDLDDVFLTLTGN